MVDINVTLIIQTVNFLLLYWLLDMILFKPLLRVMDERKARLNSLAEGFADEKEEIKGLENEYQSKLGEAYQSSAKIRREAKDVATKEGQQILERAKAEAQKIYDDKVKQLDKDLDKLRSDLSTKEEEVADCLSSKMI